MITPAFGNWLAGFIDGEGSFLIRRNNSKRSDTYICTMRICLRIDDADILREIQERTGIGRLWGDEYHWRRASGHRQLCWMVQKGTDCLLLVALLEKYPLRAKKARDYAIWREAIRYQMNSTVGRGRARPNKEEFMAQMVEYKKALEGARRFVESVARKEVMPT